MTKLLISICFIIDVITGYLSAGYFIRGYTSPRLLGPTKASFLGFYYLAITYFVVFIIVLIVLFFLIRHYLIKKRAVNQ